LIATAEEVKTLLQITGTTKDTLIDLLLPLIESDIHTYTKNDFIKDDEETYINKKTISFETTGNKILDSGNEMNTFSDNQTIKVFGSKSNDGIYYIDSVSGDYNYLSINDESTLIDESADNDIRIYRVTYPKELKLVFSQMVNYKLNVSAPNITSESIDDYSVSFDQNINNGYPVSIIKALSRFSMYYKKEY